MKDYKNRYVLPITQAVRRRRYGANVFYGTVFFVVSYLSLYTMGGYPL